MLSSYRSLKELTNIERGHKTKMTTKEQERKALDQIKKIVDGLGEGSYIATAMTGVWGVIEENIENDFAISAQDKFDKAERACEELRKKEGEIYAETAKLRKELDIARNERDGFEKEVVSLKNCNAELHHDLCKVNDELRESNYDNSNLAMEIASLKDEIIHLKAKLYDFMLTVKGGE